MRDEGFEMATLRSTGPVAVSVDNRCRLVVECVTGYETGIVEIAWTESRRILRVR